MIRIAKTVLFAFLCLILSACAAGSGLTHKMTAQTEHFEIYCQEADKAAFEKLAGELEQYCRRVETGMEIDKPQKIKLVVYPTKEVFNEEFGLPADNKNAMYGDKGVISTISPSEAEMYPSYYYQASGILPYVIMKSAYKAPEYLLHGAAKVEGGSAFDGKTALKLAEDGLCDIKELKNMNNSELSADPKAVLTAYMLSDYIQSEFGKDAYIKLLKKPKIKSVLGVGEEELRQGCAEYIKKTYAEIPFDMRKETEHFRFYCEEKDVSSIDDTVTRLEENYDRITSDLQVTLTDKTDVVLYPSKEAFYKGARGSGASAVEQDLAGYWHNGIIYLLSPAILTVASDSVPNTALHEFVHAVTAAALGSVYEKEGITHMPQYLSEGIACYEAGEYAYSFMDANELIKSGKFPDFDELEKMNYPANPEVYSLGSLFCEFVSRQYGQDKLVEILKTSDIEAALGKNKKDIQARWLEYLKQEYNIK